MLTEKQLLQKKKEIKEANEQLSELKGEEKSFMRILKEKYNCDTIADANALLKKSNKKLETLRTSLAEQLETIEKKYFSEDD